MPPKLALMSLLDIARKPRWVYKHLTTPKIEVANVAHRPPPGSDKLGGIIQYLNNQIDKMTKQRDGLQAELTQLKPYIDLEAKFRKKKEELQNK